MFSKNRPYYNFDINANDPTTMDTLTSDAITTTAENRIDITGGVNLRIGSVSEAISGAVKLNASGLQAHSTGLFCTNVESEELNKGINKLIFNTSTNEIQRSSTLTCSFTITHEGDDRIAGVVIRDGDDAGNIIFDDDSLGLVDATHNVGAVNLGTNTIHIALTFKASATTYDDPPTGVNASGTNLTLSASSASGGTGVAVFTGIEHDQTYALTFVLVA
tara:strand:- start:13 stop:669 length:657 start_codon:yes stop_codon:yes gene_type:complete